MNCTAKGRARQKRSCTAAVAARANAQKAQLFEVADDTGDGSGQLGVAQISATQRCAGVRLASTRARTRELQETAHSSLSWTRLLMPLRSGTLSWFSPNHLPRTRTRGQVKNAPPVISESPRTDMISLVRLNKQVGTVPFSRFPLNNLPQWSPKQQCDFSRARAAVVAARACAQPLQVSQVTDRTGDCTA